MCNSESHVQLELRILAISGFRNLHDLISEVALITVWGTIFGNEAKSGHMILTSRSSGYVSILMKSSSYEFI